MELSERPPVMLPLKALSIDLIDVKFTLKTKSDIADSENQL